MFPNASANAVSLEAASTTASVSASFYPLAHDTGFNFVASSSDNVLFYLNTEIILATSKTAFRNIIASVDSEVSFTQGIPTTIKIPEPASTLDAMMHILYQRPFTNQPPAFKTLEDAVDAMPKYDIDPVMHLIPRNPCYQALLSYAPTYPMDLYALTARFKINHLAALASSHLLAYPISTISDKMAERIGAVYIKRLLSLHMDRLHSLRSILLAPPAEHDPTPKCNGAQEKKLTNSWAMIAVTNAWEARPDISNNKLLSSFEPLKTETACELCKKSLEARISEVVSQWANVPCTI